MAIQNDGFQTLAAFCAAVLSFAMNCAAWASPPTTSGPFLASVDRLAHANSSRKWHQDAAAIFYGTKDDEENRLILEPDAGIALTAAWHRILRAVPEEYRQQPGPLPASDIHRFIGFVEGRLCVRPPSWWADLLLDLRPHSRHSVSMPAKRNERSGFTGSASGYYVPAGLSATTNGDFLSLASVGGTCTIPAATIWNAVGRGSHLFAATDAQRWFVASHTGIPLTYALMRVEPSSGKVLWSSDVWAADYYPGHSGPGQHFATLELANDSAIVFGLVSGCGPYIEGFRMTDGKPLFRFSSRLLPFQELPQVPREKALEPDRRR
jgi:hypothetical protein